MRSVGNVRPASAKRGRRVTPREKFEATGEECEQEDTAWRMCFSCRGKGYHGGQWRRNRGYTTPTIKCSACDGVGMRDDSRFLTRYWEDIENAKKTASESDAKVATNPSSVDACCADDGTCDGSCEVTRTHREWKRFFKAAARARAERWARRERNDDIPF